MKKIAAVLLMIAILSMSGGVFAAYQDVPSGAPYSDAATRVTSLGLMEAAGGSFKPNDAVTREQFSKIMVIAAGMGDTAASFSGSTEFSDIAADSEYSGYINAAISKGFITGAVDGKFHPDDAVTYAQVCTAAIKALGYTNEDIPGTWPKNYIEKAKVLGLTEGLTFSNNAAVPRWAMAAILNRLLDTDIKATGADGAKTLADVSGLAAAALYTNYSKPEIARGPVTNLALGSIDMKDRPSVVRNTVDNTTDPATITTGEAIGIDQIKELDVVYQVTDKSGKNRYILVIDNKVTGEITGILPNKFTPQTVQVNNVDYGLGKYFDLSKLDSSDNSLKIGDRITLLLGYDGKVEDIVYSSDVDNSSCAFVLNYTARVSSEPEDFGQEYYTIKLMFVDGSVGTFNTSGNPSGVKGRLVSYSKKDDGSVVFDRINYTSLTGATLKKQERKIYYGYGTGNSSVTNNVKVFNLLSNSEGADAQVQIVNWSDLPEGDIASEKILHINTEGYFQDTNVIVTNDILEKGAKIGILKPSNDKLVADGDSGYTVLVEGKEYKFNSSTPLNGANSAVKVILQNGAITSFREFVSSEEKAYRIQALDKNRIRINSLTYDFGSNVMICIEDRLGNVKIGSLDDLRINSLYDGVYVYLDKQLDYGGKVAVIMVHEL